MLCSSLLPSVALFGLLATCANSSPLSTRATAPKAKSVSVLHQFPNGTWIENIAVRENGGVLLSVFTEARLDYIDPFSHDQKPTTIHAFPSPATSVTGITELDCDIFYVATLNFSFVDAKGEPDTGRIWRVDLRGYPHTSSPVPVSLVTKLPSKAVPNGLTPLPDANKILIADYAAGVIYRVDPSTGSTDVAINDTALAVPAKPCTANTGGVNGIHARGDLLYFTNSAACSYGSFPIDPATGHATGAPTLHFHNDAVRPDDFALAGAGNGAAFIADPKGNRIVYVAPGTDGSSGFSEIAPIAGPTSAALGRRAGDESSLYVTSTGGDDKYALSPVPVGGRLTRIVLS